MGLSGLEPPTSRLSGVRSNRLSYKPRLILQKLRCHIITLLYMFSVKVKPLFTVKLLIKSGSHLLSHAVSSIVPSAAQVLTIVFGMGTGVSPERIGTRISLSLMFLFFYSIFLRLSPSFETQDSTVYKTLTSSSLERR